MILMKRITIVILLIILAGLIFWYLTRRNPTGEAVNTDREPTQGQELETNEQNETNDQDTEALNTSNWETYTSTAHGFTIRHPQEIDIQNTGDGELLSLWGPSQQEGTEFYDGISLHFTSGSLEGKTLDDFVNQIYTDAQNDPINEQVSPVQPILIGEESGLTFDVRGYGDSTYIYLPKGEGEYLRITENTQDPSSQGFEKITDAMLQSLRLVE